MRGSDLKNFFPILLKTDGLNVLLVGGAELALQKLGILLNHSPETNVLVVAKEYTDAFILFAEQHENVFLETREFDRRDIHGKQLVITTVSNGDLSEEIMNLSNDAGILYHAAKQPELSSFYFETKIWKEQFKGEIITDSKSAILIKRPWYFFSPIKLLLYLLGTLGVMLTGHLFFTLIPLDSIWDAASFAIDSLTFDFIYFILAGFIAQMIDGALGMAYGVSATTFLLSLGISPAISSMAVHASEIFTSGVSGVMHLRFGNVNTRLFKSLLVPGVIGAILGAYVLSEFESYNNIIKPVVSAYTLFLGALIIYKVIRKKQARKKVSKAGWLGFLGGFLDSIGGGGWGPVVSSTLIARGKHPRMIVGSVNLAEFFVSLASSFTFFTVIGASHVWQPILGLISGGVCAAPIAAYLASKLNIKALMLFVGIVVVIVSLRNFLTLLF
ncbi:TSUP family transporter [Fluviicola sp.]|jgi:uncharacterized membrane protein YfcA|uniref:TSUP family transporter n=1 Tax=Fluviicola sp. TaxID=1917219 RepID=UPI002836232D|nr:TSUP family transporter [Fluviicola sp.]MDR0802011.1 TSUP family transporter [Fluviicola sp.]